MKDIIEKIEIQREKIKRLQAEFNASPTQKSATALSNAKNQEMDKLQSELNKNPEYREYLETLELAWLAKIRTYMEAGIDLK